MSRPTLLQDILNQPDSIVQVVDYQFGAGRSDLLAAAGLIRRARHVVLSGMGASLFACLPLSNYLAIHGILSVVLDAAELLHYRHRAYRAGVAVLVSRSGESVEVTKLLPILQAQGTTVIGVTCESGSQLAREADHTIWVNSRPDQSVALPTYTGMLVALFLLGAGVTSGFEPGCRRDLDTLTEALASTLPDWVDASEDWRPFFEGNQVVHLLARGASLASALEGALLFNEVAKFPSIGMGAAGFRHGPVEVVDPALRGLLFAPADSTQELNLALARDLAGLGAQVRVVGPMPEPSVLDESLYWPTPHVPAALAPVVEIVPVQLATLRLAEWRGIPAGSFRYVPRVTLAESGFGP
jgi:glucosamine--fructose-6-phosphate aminotransferase (isomerizing)